MSTTTLLIFFFTASLAQAALDSVSGFGISSTEIVAIDHPDDAPYVAYSLATGFPIWYQDSNGLKLELCLDREVEIEVGVFVDPCLLANNPENPVSFPNNFGGEARWWSATTFGTFLSRHNGELLAGDALLVQALEAGFNLGTLDNEQVASSRIRLRISLPVSGTYLVEHPFGERTYPIDIAGRRAINQTQNIGNYWVPGPPPSGDFTEALFDRNDGLIPAPQEPFFNEGVVNVDGRSIGPFLVPATGPGGAELPLVTALDGRQYIALPGTEVDIILSSITRAPGPYFNGLRITLLAPPDDFFLNAANNSQTVEFTDFQVMGKLFNDGPNLRPTAMPDFAGTAKNTPVRIDVAANDLDPIGPANVHGLNPQAIGLPVDQAADANLRAGILLTQALPTAQGGIVRRFTTVTSGKTEFIYTPPPGFSGEDSFYYVVQDAGGLISQPALVTVTVEELELEAASYRTRLGKWSISGTSSAVSGNTLTFTLGPRARLSGAPQVPPVENLTLGQATLRLGEESIEFRLELNPLPAGAVTQAHIHVGAPGENGPIIFFLYDWVLDPSFTGMISGTLSSLHLIPRPAAGVSSFADAINAILAGRAYVNVHTANPAGEVRGQLKLVPLGSVDVGPEGAWSFPGKSAASPGPEPRGINLNSTYGVRILGVPFTVQ